MTVRIQRRRVAKVKDQHDRSTPLARVNTTIAIWVTRRVGSMWCAYLFTALALLGLPTALHPGGAGIVSWVAQTFLQLVLLSIILVGQDVQAQAADKRATDTYNDTEELLRRLEQLADGQRELRTLIHRN